MYKFIGKLFIRKMFEDELIGVKLNMKNANFYVCVYFETADKNKQTAFG